MTGQFMCTPMRSLLAAGARPRAVSWLKPVAVAYCAGVSGRDPFAATRIAGTRHANGTWPLDSLGGSTG